MSGLSLQQKKALGQMMLEGLKKRDPEIIAGCIRRGGDPDFPVSDNGSAEKPVLHWAMSNFNAAAAKVVLAASSSVDVRDAMGNTALFAAIEARNVQAVTFLMQNGADMAAENYHKTVALDLARQINANYYAESRYAIINALTAKYNTAADKPAAVTPVPEKTTAREGDDKVTPPAKGSGGGISFQL